ncbi:MAG TPA: prepilin-type N-terminal cleavage/methylation domain-containing protein [Polyangiaceae bacterium]|nr:prepilin-type N-terminal cleavage/methylation domain-containing protein [Polyangiaceae bacterium]
MSQRAFAQGRRQRGYTLVEIMMALAIFMVAMLGMFTMQKAAVSANMHARSAGLAQHLARSWASQLEMDATQWRATQAGDWVNGVGQGSWLRPAYVVSRNFGARFDALGNPLKDTPEDQALTRFCTNVRLTPLPLDTMGLAGNGVLRAEIRVYWLRDGASPTLPFCTEDAAQAALLGLRSDLYQFVYITTAVRQHSTI